MRGSKDQRINELLAKTSYHLMKSDDERENLFRLRYEAYLKEGAILPSNCGRLHDPFDNLPNAFNIGVRVEDRLVGAMRICVWSREFAFETTPGIEVFRTELTPYLLEDTTLIEASRFVMDTNFTRSEIGTTFLAMRIPWMACIKFNATMAICAARKEHCGFYRRYFGYKQLTEPRPYLGLIKHVALLICDFPANRQSILDRHLFFAARGDDLENIFSEVRRR